MAEDAGPSVTTTRIPRVRTPQLPRHVVSQKPPTGGGPTTPTKVAKPKRSTSSAPSSRCSSPSPKLPNGKYATGSLDRQLLNSSPKPGKRAMPGSPVVKRMSAPSSPNSRRNSLVKSSPADKPPSSPGLRRVQKISGKAAKVSSGVPRPTPVKAVQETPGKRVPTPMIQRKDLGAHSDIPRNRSPIVSLTNQVETGDLTIGKLKNFYTSDGDDSDLSSPEDNGSSNKENRMLSSHWINLANDGKDTQTVTCLDKKVNGGSKSAENLSSVQGPSKIPEPSSTTSSSSTSLPSTIPNSVETVPLKVSVLQLNANNNCPTDKGHSTSMDTLTDSHTSVIQNMNRLQGTGSLDNLDKQTRRYSSGMAYDMLSSARTQDNGDVRTYSARHRNMNVANNNRFSDASSYTRTYPGHSSTFPVGMTTSMPPPGQRSLMSMSLPVLSGHSAYYNDPRNNNNIKNLLSSSTSKLTDVIPKNAGEELSSADIGDDSMFVCGMPVIYPESLELGGQGLCENCDDVKSPDSPNAEQPIESSSSASSLMTQSCPNLSFEDSGLSSTSQPQDTKLPSTPQSLLPQDVVFEKYPPIRSLDVNKLEQYREEQLREYYQYLQDMGNKNGWLSDANSGQEVQRISVITQLPTLLDPDNNSECMRRVVPKIREVLHVAQPDMQLAACSTFLQILQEEKVPLQSYTQTFLQTILNNIDNRDPDVAGAWLETLLDVLDLLPKDIIKRDIMALAIAKGQLSQSVHSRLSCCKILGKVATKFDPFIIKKDILPVVQSLCQDVDYEVRGCMCRQLDSVARGLGLDHTKSAILPELVELTNDEESFVRLAGLETVVSILSLLDDETCTQTIVPLVCKFCQQALGNEDSTLPAVAKQLGKLCHGLQANLTDEQKQWFIEFYQKLCKFGAKNSKHRQDQDKSPSKQPNAFPMFPNDVLEETDVFEETRRNAGFNFPAMVLFCGARHFKSDLFSGFHALCTDSHASVRRTVTSGFHEVAKALSNSASILLPEFIHLLNDDSIEVLKGLIEHLPQSLDILIKSAKNHSTSDNKTPSHEDLLAAILSCEAVVFSSNNWRLQEEYVQQLTCVSRSFTSDQIYARVTPLLLKKMATAKALPVKLAAARTLLVLMRQNRRLEQREEICQGLVDEFCRSSSCHGRSLFLDVCRCLLELFSRAFFKEYFFEYVLELSADPVPNVRLRLCPLLPRLKALLKLPGDRTLLQLLEQCARKVLVSDKDRDVTEAIDRAIKEMDKVEVQMESITKKPVFSSDDLADKKKFEEENKLLELEEQAKKEEELKASKADKKKEAKKDGSSSKIPAPKRGVKVPAATSITKDKGPPTGKERSSSFSGNTQTTAPSANSKGVTRSTSFNNHCSATNKSKPPSSKESLELPGRSRATGSASSTASSASRKGSASSVTSSSSGTKARRSSIPLNSLGTDVTKKSSGPHRKFSAGNMPPSNGTGGSSRKK